MRGAGQEEMLRRVRVLTLPSWRKDSRRRMAGGEFRLGTSVTYMSSCINRRLNTVKRIKNTDMTT